MKRAKIMLVAIAVLATVGGALAFKANNKFQLAKYCTIAPDNKCTLFINATTTTGTAAFTTYYKLTTANSCASGLECEAASTSFTTQEQ